MANTYVTFGQMHDHVINGEVFDKDCIAVIKCGDYTSGRELAFQYFGDKFGTSYYEDEFTANILSFFPRGLIEVN